MVGIQICGSVVRIERALPRPVVLPPPMETMQSAEWELRKSIASVVMLVGVCIVALV